MEWTQLRVAEAGWDLSHFHMNLLTERVYQRATGPRTLNFSIFKPILGVAAMAVLVFGLLLLWPKKPVEEQVVTLPGSSEARPGEYVEKEPADETLPTNEDASDEDASNKDQSSELTPEMEEKLPATDGDRDENLPATDEDQEEKLPATGGEQADKLPTSDGDRDENLSATDEDQEGEPPTTGGEQADKLPTSDGDRDENLPATDEDQEEKLPANGGEQADKLPTTDGDQDENLSATDEDQEGEPPTTGGEQADKLPTPDGDQEEKPAKESKTPAIHRFWETEEEMPYEEAVAIVKEKVENRPFEPLTDKERMAYYQCISNTTSVYYDASLENYRKNGPPKEENLDQWYHAKVKAPIFSIELLTTDAGVHFDLMREHPLKLEDKGYKVFNVKTPTEIKETTKDSYAQQQYINIIEIENGTILDAFYDSIDLKHGSGRGVYYFSFEGVNVFEQEISYQTIRDIVKHYLSLDFVTWLEIRCDYQIRVIDD